MFNKSEESEWTRFSRALGGTQSPPAVDDEPAPAAPAPAPEPVTIAQAPEPEVYVPPAFPAREPEPTMPDLPPYNPGTVAAPAYSPPPVSAPQIGRASATTNETVVGEGASFEGTVRSERSIRILGAVQGEIESKDRVVVEESARVEARITAQHVTVLGEVNGSIECAGRLEIASSARVTGEVSASTLVIQEGAFFEGNLKMSSGSHAGN